MSKNKRQKKGKVQQQLGGYKHFLNDMYQFLNVHDIGSNLKEMPNEYKRLMYEHRIHINNPKAGNEYISSKELKLISDKTRRYYLEQSFEVNGKMISTYQIKLLYCYVTIRMKELEKKLGDKEHPDVVVFKDRSDKLMETFYKRYLIDCFRVVTQLSNPDQKYYGIRVRPAAIFKENPSLELVTDVYGVPARKCMMEINGDKRPAFQLGKAIATTPVEWISVDTSLLGSFYTGSKKELDVYIQSHALRRLRERLDLLDQEAINYALWENTSNIKQFENYMGYLLLPFDVFNVKIGYLIANVIDEKLLFRTFLFITHNSTPEGDRLKKMTGLGKQDIIYWHIDRLSTFVNLNEDKYPELIHLFQAVGIGDLMQLKYKKFNIDTMQAANLDGLTEYIHQGQQAISVQDQEWSALLNEDKQKSNLHAYTDLQYG